MVVCIFPGIRICDYFARKQFFFLFNCTLLLFSLSNFCVLQDVYLLLRLDLPVVSDLEVLSVDLRNEKLVIRLRVTFLTSFQLLNNLSI